MDIRCFYRVGCRGYGVGVEVGECRQRWPLHHVSSLMVVVPSGHLQQQHVHECWRMVIVVLCRAAVTSQNAEGALAPTQKGASLSQAEWGVLHKAIPDISQALDDHNDSFLAQLSTSKRATVAVLRCVRREGGFPARGTSSLLVVTWRGVLMQPVSLGWSAHCVHGEHSHCAAFFMRACRWFLTLSSCFCCFVVQFWRACIC